METIQAFYLAILQGFTEFLPISSSAHLILFPFFSDLPLQDISFDVAVHLGSLFAVLIYYRKGLAIYLVASKNLLLKKEINANNTLVMKLLVATLPVVIIGAVFHNLITSYLRNPVIIAITTIVFGLLLLIVHYSNSQQSDLTKLSWKIAILIGCAQTLALIPGVSRSGLTITAAVLLGLSKQTAIKISFLLSIPVIIAAVSFESFNIIINDIAINWTLLIFASTVSFFTAYFVIYAFIKYLDFIGFIPFVIYRLMLGITIIYLVSF